MVAKIQPQPHPTYLLSDGTPNALGKLELTAAGTATPKVAYKDAAMGTSYGSTIALDAYGKPEDGAIYWDGSYKVTEYYRVDSVPTYALVDNGVTDNFGDADTSLSANGLIESNTAWTVDGVGAGATEWATLSEAMTAARLYTIVGGSILTITLDDGTYLNDVVDFTHPQGENIAISGTTESGTILRFTTATAPVLTITDGQIIKSISNMTLDQQGSDLDTLLIDHDARLILLDNVTLDGNSTAKGIHVTDHATARINNIVVHDATTGVVSANEGVILQEGVITFTTVTTALKTVTDGTIMLDDTNPTFTTVTTEYDPGVTSSEDGTGTLVDMVRDVSSNTSQIIPQGLVLSRDSGDTSHDINITAGAVKPTDTTYDMILTTEITKKADATWAVGDDAGGHFDGGASMPTSGMVAVYLIKNPTTGVVDAGFDTSFTSPTLPSGYTLYRLIGGWVTDASANFIAGTHKGMYFDWQASTLAINDTTMVTVTPETATVTCPPNCLYHHNSRLRLTAQTANADLAHSVYHVDYDAFAGGGESGIGYETGGASQSLFSPDFALTDSSSQVKYACKFEAGTFSYMKVWLKGWTMLTRNTL